MFVSAEIETSDAKNPGFPTFYCFNINMFLFCTAVVLADTD